MLSLWKTINRLGSLFSIRFQKQHLNYFTKISKDLWNIMTFSIISSSLIIIVSFKYSFWLKPECQTNPALRCWCRLQPSSVPPLTGSLHWDQSHTWRTGNKTVTRMSSHQTTNKWVELKLKNSTNKRLICHMRWWHSGSQTLSDNDGFSAELFTWYNTISK